MNFFSAVVFLVAAAYVCSAEVAEIKLGNAKTFFVPLPFIPVPARPPTAPAVTTTTSAPAVTTTTPAPVGNACPARCCKRYCLNGDFCTTTPAAGGAPATYACTPASTALRCINTESSGCSAASCTANPNCSNNCGTVMNVAKIAICA